MSHTPDDRLINTGVITSTVLIGALGYFVDIYDLLLFGIVRVPSLIGIGVPEDKLLDVGVYLINMQMGGMLIGGILWGILGDKKGRVSVLFGSIFLYSIANICNAFIHSVGAYGILRFVAGVGLAGELGAAITLVSETLSKENRGIGTTFVASVGVLGAVFAGLIGDYFQWQTAYLIGGGMGLLLLLMRVSIFEPGMYKAVQDKNVRRGDLRILFSSWKNLKKYIECILVGVPFWYVVGILITFSPEIARELHVQGHVDAGRSILFCYLGTSIGDIASGYFSQALRSRKKVVFLFLVLTLILIGFYLGANEISVATFYGLCVGLGFAIGYWAVFMTIAAEQFGTNIRATVATTAPNFVRGSVILLTFTFQALQVYFGMVQSAWIVGLICITAALLSVHWLPETFGKELDYIEE